MASSWRALSVVAAGAAAALVLTAADPAGAALAATTQRVSVSSAGVQGNDLTDAAVIAAGGRYVAFSSYSSNLVPSDTNVRKDVFVRDLQTGTTSRVSVSTAGVQSNDNSVVTSISSDGRLVAFQSEASNLVAGDTNGETDAFVRDRLNGTTNRISVSSTEAQGNQQSLHPKISDDGRYVAFQSDATNLVAGDTNGAIDVFVRDRQAGTTRRVSLSNTGAQGHGRSYDPYISATGRYVSFTSGAPNLVIGDTNRARDVFVRDRDAGTTTRVSVSSTGVQGFASDAGPVSADGRYVAFSSAAKKFVAGDTNDTFDAFVRDRTTNTTTRVSVSSSGGQGNLDSKVSAASADFRYVVFRSLASNLVTGDSNMTYDVFVRDRESGTTGRVSVSTAGAEGHGVSSPGSMSADGRFVAFTSVAPDLLPPQEDTNNTEDAFVRDRGTP